MSYWKHLLLHTSAHFPCTATHQGFDFSFRLFSFPQVSVLHFAYFDLVRLVSIPFQQSLVRSAPVQQPLLQDPLSHPPPSLFVSSAIVIKHPNDPSSMSAHIL